MREFDEILEKYIGIEYNDEDTFNKLGVDSFGLICMIQDIEDELKIRITDDELKNIYTIKDAKDIYEHLIKEKQEKKEKTI